MAEKSGQPADADPGLASIARSDSAVRDLAEWLAFGSDVRHLEQEALDPATLSLASDLFSSGGRLQG
jgi:hypothetical protein